MQKIVGSYKVFLAGLDLIVGRILLTNNSGILYLYPVVYYVAKS